MFAAFDPREAHLFEHPEDLLKVELLGSAHDVKQVIKLVAFVPVNGRRKIAGGIEGRPVLFFDQACRKPLQLDDQRAFAFGEQAFFLKESHRLFHRLVVGALSLVAVEVDTEPLINPFELFERETAKLTPQPGLFLPAVFQGFESRPGLILQRGIGFGLLVKTDVEVEEFANGILLEPLGPPKFTVGDDQLAKLGAPVAQVVDPDGRVTQAFKNPGQRVSDDGRPQVPHVEGLGDVGRGEIEHDRPSAAHLGLAVLVAPGENLGDDPLASRRPVEEKVDVGFDNVHSLDQSVRTELFRQFLSDAVGRFAQDPGQLKAREGVVAEARIGRHFDRPCHVKLLNAQLSQGFFHAFADMLPKDVSHRRTHLSTSTFHIKIKKRPLSCVRRGSLPRGTTPLDRPKRAGPLSSDGDMPSSPVTAATVDAYWKPRASLGPNLRGPFRRRLRRDSHPHPLTVNPSDGYSPSSSARKALPLNRFHYYSQAPPSAARAPRISPRAILCAPPSTGRCCS